MSEAMNWEKEAMEQARLNGMGSEREARQLARIAELERELAAKDALIAKLREALEIARGEVVASRKEHADYASRHGAESPYADGKTAPEYIDAAIAATPETAFSELAELREDKARFTILAELLCDVRIGDIDPTQHFQHEGNWTEAWRDAIDATRKGTVTITATGAETTHAAALGPIEGLCPRDGSPCECAGDGKHCCAEREAFGEPYDVGAL